MNRQETLTYLKEMKNQLLKLQIEKNIDKETEEKCENLLVGKPKVKVLKRKLRRRLV